MDISRVDLAHAPDFRIGPLAVRPARRQLARDDGAEEVIEPRVMQVLVALANAHGGIVTRDELTQACWEGRVVGEDAINRVISRLRRSAEGIGSGAFVVETVTKVGYRLVAGDGEDADEPRAEAPPRAMGLSRRWLVGAGGAAVAAAAIGGGAWWRHARPADDRPPPAVAALVDQAVVAMGQGSVEGGSQAVGLLRRVTELAPDYADGWGLLALAYSAAAQRRPGAYEADMRLRAAAAVRRVEAIDPTNIYVHVASGLLTPLLGNWGAIERGLRAGLARHPGHPLLIGALASVLDDVGRCREAATLVDTTWPPATMTPGAAYGRVVVLWSANRLDDADRAMAEAYALFPTHFSVWFTRFYLLLYTGRAQEALGFAQDLDGRPTGIPEDNFAMIVAVAKAMISRDPAAIDQAMRANVAAAHTGAGFAENTVQFGAALGRLDDAFAVAGAYFFDRGFAPGDLRFSPEQRVYTRRSARRTRFLFLPSTAPMRRDPRFARLADEVGLARYWREAGVKPDYRM